MVHFARDLAVKHEYPDLEFLIEPAASDFLNLWGASFVWDYHIGGPATWPQYLSPGLQINAVIKRGRMKNKKRAAERDPVRFNQLVKWGYVPLVFQPINQPFFDLSSGKATTAAVKGLGQE